MLKAQLTGSLVIMTFIWRMWLVCPPLSALEVRSSIISEQNCFICLICKFKWKLKLILPNTVPHPANLEARYHTRYPLWPDTENPVWPETGYPAYTVPCCFLYLKQFLTKNSLFIFTNSYFVLRNKQLKATAYLHFPFK